MSVLLSIALAVSPLAPETDVSVEDVVGMHRAYTSGGLTPTDEVLPVGGAAKPADLGWAGPPPLWGRLTRSYEIEGRLYQVFRLGEDEHGDLLIGIRWESGEWGWWVARAPRLPD